MKHVRVVTPSSYSDVCRASPSLYSDVFCPSALEALARAVAPIVRVMCISCWCAVCCFFQGDCNERHTRVFRAEAMRDTPIVLYSDCWLFDKIHLTNCKLECACIWIACWCDVIWLRWECYSDLRHSLLMREQCANIGLLRKSTAARLISCKSNLE